ncbi:AraC family transcriptional regulator [Chryseobacterium glaciei]|nr:AraC family transcriptional regulator [Chryseobacterium glaciei]
MLPLVGKYIQKARIEKNYPQLVEGYKDGLLYSVSPDDKLKYADSAIWAAKLTRDDYLIGRAYTSKGIVYYFNLKKYKLALNEFLIAYKYSQKSNDPYYKNKVYYLLGVVKSYIGNYDEALVLLKQTKTFFEEESKKDIHPNLRYGNKRGYYNSLHQMAVCYRNLGNQKSADSLTNIGLSLTSSNKDYQQEYGYFLKEKGIGQFYKRDYHNSIKSLESSITSISGVNDFAWTSVCYSYIGKSYLELGNMDNAMPFFQKVDSVFQKHHFILPELRNNYEVLIDHYKEKGDIKKELYYTKQLIKADEIIRRDFGYLFSKIHREYDTNTLLDGKTRLERRISQIVWIVWTLATIAAALMIALFFKHRSEKKIRKQYRLLEQKILSKDELIAREGQTKGKENYKLDIEQKIVDDILLRLRDFEDSSGFIESGLTLNKLAARFVTNHSYLSQVINDYKGMNFNRYLSELRIAFITDKLYKERKYLHYKIETLAEECGMASRTNFSNLFQEINGIRPTDFIKQRLQDTDQKSIEE